MFKPLKFIYNNFWQLSERTVGLQTSDNEVCKYVFSEYRNDS